MGIWSGVSNIGTCPCIFHQDGVAAMRTVRWNNLDAMTIFGENTLDHIIAAEISS